MPTPARLPLGSVVGDYRIVRAMHEAARGALYVAERTGSGGTALVRALPWTGAAVGAERFGRDARTVPAIETTRVVPVLGAGVDAAHGCAWTAHPPLSGEVLAHAIERSGAVHAADLLEIFTQLGETFAQAHAAGAAHGALEAEDVFLAVEPGAAGAFSVRLLGFGVATLARSGPALGDDAAPEERAGARPSPASDVWALGHLAFEMLVGARYGALAAKRPVGSAGEPAAPATLESASARAGAVGMSRALPAGFDEWFARCTAAAPAERFRDGGAAATALAALLARAVSPTFRAGNDPPPAPYVPPEFTPWDDDARSGRESIPGDEPRRSSIPGEPSRRSEPQLAFQPTPSASGTSVDALPPVAAGGGPGPGFYFAAVFAVLAAFGGGVLVGLRLAGARAQRESSTEPTGADLTDGPRRGPVASMPPPPVFASMPAPPPPPAPTAPAAPVVALPAAPRNLTVASGAGGRIFDYHTTTAAAQVAEPCAIDTLDVTVRGAHTFASDMIVRLRAPNGATATLQSHASRSPFRRYPVAQFAGLQAQGAWQLSITDDVGADSGNLAGFTLQVACRPGS